MKYSFDFSNTTFCFHTRALSKKLHVFFSPIFYGEPRFGMILSLRCHSTKFVNFLILATLFVWQTQEFVKFCMNAFFQKFMQLRFFNDEIRIWHLFFSQGNKIGKRFVFVDFCCQIAYPWEKGKCHTRKSSYFFIFFFFKNQWYICSVILLLSSPFWWEFVTEFDLAIFFSKWGCCFWKRVSGIAFLDVYVYLFHVSFSLTILWADFLPGAVQALKKCTIFFSISLLKSDWRLLNFVGSKTWSISLKLRETGGKEFGTFFHRLHALGRKPAFIKFQRLEGWKNISSAHSIFLGTYGQKS